MSKDEPAWGPAVRHMVAESHASLAKLSIAGVAAATTAVSAEIDRYWNDDNVEPGHDLVAQRAVEAYLVAAKDMPCWHPIANAPHACHVLAIRFDHDCGEWVYGVVMSPPIYPFTHWQPLPKAPATEGAAS